MKNSELINELAAALIKAHEDFKPAVKSATNPAFRSKYATLEDVIKATSPALLKHGIVTLQGIEGNIDDRSVTINTRLLHSSGQWIEDALTLPAINRNNFDPQAVGSAITYGRRYALMAILNIPAEDDDANAATEEVRQQPKVISLQQANALKDIANKKDPDAVKKLMAELKITRLSAVTVDQYHNFKDTLEGL